MPRSKRRRTKFYVIVTNACLTRNVVYVQCRTDILGFEGIQLRLSQSHGIGSVLISTAQKGEIGRNKFSTCFKNMAARTKREFLLKVMGMFKIVENGTRLSNCRKRRSARVLHCNRRGRWVVGHPVIPTKHRNLIVGFSRQIRTNDVIVFKGNQVGTVRNFSSCRRENNPPFQASPLTGNVKTSYVDPQT